MSAAKLIGDTTLERDLVARVFVEPETYALVEGTVRPEDFMSPAFGAVWAAFGDLARRRMPIDRERVRVELERTKRLDVAGGDESLYLDSLGTLQPERVALEVAALATRRRVREATLSLAADAADVAIETEAFLESAEKRLADVLAGSDLGGGPKPISVGATEVYERLQRLSRAGRSGVTGLSTGLSQLDQMTTGMQPGELIIVAGRPGMGKSSFARMAPRIAAEEGKLAVIFSLEMPREQVAAAMIAAESGVDLKRMRAAQLGTREWEALAKATNTIADLPIEIDETPEISIAHLRSRCRRMRAKYGAIGVVAIDYLQLMRGSNRKDPREQQISEISRGLKALAKELACPVIALAQLNRACEQRPGKRPQLSDLRESGAIEQDADTVWLLYRRGYYAEQAAKESEASGKRHDPNDIPPGTDDGMAEVIVAKQRNGPTGSVSCRFIASTAKFEDLEGRWPHGY